MTVKMAVTLILGLVFQLAQVLPGAFVTMPCAPLADSCECCVGPDSCPCAENGEPEQKPAPLAPDSGSGLKLPVAKAGETRVSIESTEETHSSASKAASPIEGLLGGYAGVRLSVAFCSFVI